MFIFEIDDIVTTTRESFHHFNMKGKVVDIEGQDIFVEWLEDDPPNGNDPEKYWPPISMRGTYDVATLKLISRPEGKNIKTLINQAVNQLRNTNEV